MKNADIAAIFYAMADILEIQKVQWKPNAYRKAARMIEMLQEPIENVYEKGGLKALMDIPGVGEALAKKIEQFFHAGKIDEYEKMKREMPEGLTDLVSVPGLGPKKAYRLYQELNIRSLSDLEKACKKHAIANLEGFGKKSESNIMNALELVKKGRERMLLGVALPIADEIVGRLNGVRGVVRVEVAGSLRRRAETVGDIDILVTAKYPGPVMELFTSMPEADNILAKGQTKSAIVFRSGRHYIQTDVRVVEDGSFGAALQYFTGNKEHNIAMRRIAISKGYKLNEYGLFDKKNKTVAGKDEEGVYRALGMRWIPPELRENQGEIDVAIKGRLPNLIEQSDIKGDLHTHTKWTDGNNTVDEMAGAAERMGYEYICITDHSKSTTVANGMNEERLLEYIDEVKGVAKTRKNIRVLVGSEVDITADGELDYSDEYLKKLDIVSASVHSRFKSDKKEMTERVLTAFTNRYLKVFCHPTGRIIHQREPYEIDLDRIFEEAAQNRIALEVDSIPDRLDLNSQQVKKAIEAEVKLVIDTDSHEVEGLHFMQLGVATARRGWAEKKDVLNALPFKELAKYWKLKS